MEQIYAGKNEETKEMKALFIVIILSLSLALGIGVIIIGTNTAEASHATGYTVYQQIVVELQHLNQNIEKQNTILQNCK